MSRRCSRRTVVRSACLAVVGTVAGCLGTDSTQDGTDQPEATTAPPATTGSTTADAGTETASQPTVESFLSDTSNFDGVVDRTGADAVGVDVGVEANGAFFGFGPAAVRVDQGTTVTWTWTGQGSTHNVVARHGAAFASEQSGEEGFTFEHGFDEPGAVLYVCVPHEGAGMKGAVVVE
ncbi:halocyanin domain-containing protein [Haloarchaeobius iranensis]|uniref:Halocyanin domain-containing protein n=1 Tax=Haloarchaeobius iranensis TaxID=996166 RepID=A0A1H0A7A0_9EURY|nr:halocyanin domain-containing protein [Haloarchaeobius iranensis]SDN29267.1 halocyanin domain-containing protein [Haloarchaeobius iranensis]